VSSLGRHLTTPAPHGALPFHPGCPTCRDTRLHGSIPDGPIVPARVKASLATALVTVSAAGAGPGVSVAQEVDEQIEGTELPQPNPERGPDPGDETRVADDESVAVPGLGGGDADDDSEGPALESEPETAPPDHEAHPVPSPPDDVGVTAPPVPAPEALPAPAPPAEALGRETKDPRRPSPRHRADAKDAPPRGDSTATPPPEPSLAAPSLEGPRSLPSGSDRPAAASPPSERPSTERASRKHTVRPGESLWSIAAGLADDDASPARIARLVNRLWSLNADRIGTGNPDLVMAGTTLRLP